MKNVTPTVIRYYTDAGPDYSNWSANFNMHFGYYRRGMSLFNLEAMLEYMNHVVLAELGLTQKAPETILDMGCGVGATLQYACKLLNNVTAYGLTIVPWQIKRARELDSQQERSRVHIIHGDYTAAPFPDNSFDGVFALESSCYCEGLAKEPLVREMYRVLKPGRRFVVADCFLKTRRKMSSISRACYQALCECWALDTLGMLDEFTQALETVGFKDVKVRNISRNVTPSVLHIPPTMFRFLRKQVWTRSGIMNRNRFSNMMAGPLLMGFALDRSRSGYFMISGTKQ